MTLTLEPLRPIIRAPGTFLLGCVVIGSLVWLLFMLMNENHFGLFVGLQIAFQAFALEALWQLCEKRAGLREPQNRG